MSLIYLDGFDTYQNAEINTFWMDLSGLSANGIDQTNARTGTGCLGPGAQGLARGMAIPPDGNPQGRNSAGPVWMDLYIGVAIFYPGGFPVGNGIRVYLTNPPGTGTVGGSGGSVQATLNVDLDGVMYVAQGGESGARLQCDPAFPMDFRGYNFVEWHIQPTLGGVCEVRLNGQTILATTGTFLEGTLAGADVFMLRGAGGGDQVRYDDLYVLTPDGIGTNTTFLTDSQVFDDLPSGDGSTTQWVVHTNTLHYLNVNETPADDGTTYNEGTASGDIDLYLHSSNTRTTAIVRGIQQWLKVEDPLAASTPFTPTVDSVIASSNSTTAAAFYNPYIFMWEDDPVTVSTWVMTNVNTRGFGIERL